MDLKIENYRETTGRPAWVARFRHGCSVYPG
jgi:hypothetical protein